MTTPELITDEIVKDFIKYMQGYKRDAKAYEFALKDIRFYCEASQPDSEPYIIADNALKGDDRKTDFTVFSDHMKRWSFVVNKFMT